MSNMLYHGSIVPDIAELSPRSRLHGTGERVVYLTDSVPYALFYIWDGERNGDERKYVTGGFREGVAFYEEQFPDQLRTFYQGVSGYLYQLEASPETRPVHDREGLYYQAGAVRVAKVEFIPDVYEALTSYEAAGALKVLRYSAQSPARQEELTEMIASYIRQNAFFEQDDVRRRFMQRHFDTAWRAAMGKPE